jgi:large subunit ribosomal protein L25
METIAIKADIRDQARSKGANATRAEGKIPCVVYGGNEVQTVAIEFNDVRHAIYTPEFKICELDIDGKKERCIVKDIQFHPVSDDIVHIDFLRLIPGHEVKVEVPIHFEGTAVGIRQGGNLVKKLRRVQIKATPENLVDHIIIDLTNLNLGDSLNVGDLDVDEAIEIMTPLTTPVASVVVPRALLTVTPAEGEEEEGEGEGEEGEGAPAEASEEAAE